MKTIISKAAPGIILAILLSIAGIQKTSAQTYCTTNGNEYIAGESDGYSYVLWNQNSQGTACMTVGNGALFSGEWNGILNYLARRGLSYDETQLHHEIGWFYTTFDCDYNPNAASGNSYLSVYGWTVNPLIEYYIVEDWRNWIPSMAAGATQKGSITVNGSVYDIWQNTRVNQPSIIGTATFEQYFSIRRNKRNSGTINISDHFNKWEEKGMEMGKMYEVTFVVEGYQSSGSFEFTELEVIASDDPLPTEEKTTEPSQVKIYPNPNSGDLSVYLGSTNLDASMRIYDSAGRIVHAVENINDELVHVTDLKNGTYYVHVNNNILSHSSKFVVYRSN